jgi:hypothetical protein
MLSADVAQVTSVVCPRRHAYSANYAGPRRQQQTAVHGYTERRY